MIRYCIMYSRYIFVGEFWVSANDGDTPYVCKIFGRRDNILSRGWHLEHQHKNGGLDIHVILQSCSNLMVNSPLFAELLPASNVLVCTLN